MNVGELAQKLNLTLMGEGNSEQEITGCYVGDLLSLAMSRVERGNVWITIQTNLNVVAVASLTEAACIIVPDSVEVEKETMERAEEQGVFIATSPKSAYELCCAIGAVL